MEQEKYDVFICFSRKDYLDDNNNVIPGNEVSRIIDALKKASISFWFDPEGIVSSDVDYIKTIIKHIKAASIFVYLSTSSANTSEWLSNEICSALLFKKTIIPVRIDDSPYNDSFRLLISEKNHINYGVNPQEGCKELINSIKQHLIHKQMTPIREIDEKKKYKSKKVKNLPKRYMTILLTIVVKI